MKSYNDLSLAGKVRRLHDLAVTALTHYDLASPQITYHGFATNLLYRVTTASGERFMLRLAAPGWRTFEDLLSEALWLDALNRETTLAVPRIIPARSGEYVLPLSNPGIPDVWNTSLHELGSGPVAGTLSHGAQPGEDGRTLRRTPPARRCVDTACRIHNPAIRALDIQGRGKPHCGW